MWLSYEGYDFTPKRKTIRTDIVERNRVGFDEGRIHIETDDVTKIDECIDNIASAIEQIADMRSSS